MFIPYDMDLTETTISEGKIDKEANIIRGVKLLNQNSRNGRRYTKPAMIKSAKLYEGLGVNVDHPDKKDVGKTRGFKDRIGRIQNARFISEQDGVVGDIHYNPAHEWGAALEWWADNDPSGVALSHNAHGKGYMQDGKLIVEDFVKIRSVDLVADGGTNKGLFESLEDSFLTPEEEDITGKSNDTAIELIRESIYNSDPEASPQDKKKRIVQILEDWESQLVSEPSEADSKSNIILEESETMKDLKDVSLADIKKERPDLVESLLEEVDTSKDTKIKDEEFKRLTEENDSYKLKESILEKKTKIEGLLEEAKLPEAVISKTFFSQLMEAKEDSDIKALIEDRQDIVKAGSHKRVTNPKSKSSHADLTEGYQGGEIKNVDDLVSAIK